MRKRFIRTVFHLVGILLVGSTFAQPCLTDWRYRVPITINNSNGLALSDFQVKFVVNTQDLVVSGKAKADGGDVRVLDKAGNNLSFWIQNGTYNKPSTTIWVKLNALSASSIDSIYLFYGNSKANSVSSGQTTFEFFDDFRGSFVNTANWTKCGGGNVTVAGGEITFQSNNQASNSLITSVKTFNTPVVSEGFVNGISEGVGFMGQINSADSGFAMAYEKLGTGNKVMRMVGLKDSSTTMTCIQHFDQVPNPNTEVAGATTGLWSFVWSDDDTAQMKWPGGSVTRIDTSMLQVFSGAKHMVLGNLLNPGSISFDWYRVRKYTDLEPVLALGQEVQTITSVNVGQNGPLCQNDSLRLTSPTYVGANYSWSGPNAFSSSEQNPVIGGITSTSTGQYLVTISLPNGCSPVTGQTNVVVSDSSDIGTSAGANTVCADTNFGTIAISGQIGTITKWQEGTTASGPWVNLSDLDTFITYVNLQQTRFYRSIIKSGVCPEDTSAPVQLKVDEVSKGGNLFGNAEVCRSHNGGAINLINERGKIDKWQFSSDTGRTWTDITNTNKQLTYANIPGDRWYRLQVTNGVCPTDTSDTVFINTFDIPQVRFVTDTVCLGVSTQFSDSTRISDSKLATWIWSFEPGKGTSLQHPSYQFASAGSYSVQLKVTSNKGCVDSLSQNVVVHPGPVVNFTHQNVCDTLAMPFTNSSTVPGGSVGNYIWTFGDGDSANTRDTTHYYPNEGTYLVKLIISSNNGCLDSLSKTVVVWPRTELKFDVDSVCLGQAITFNNRSRSNANSVQYVWTFGNGDSSTLFQPNYTYNTVDTFEVSLFSTTNRGCTDAAYDTVVIFPLPNPRFAFSDECVYDTVRFINQTSIRFGELSYQWDLGDGVVSADTNPKHLYGLPDRYLVKLRVSSDKGCTGDTNHWVETFAIPEANFEFKNTCDSVEMVFTNTSGISNGSLTYRWRFGDGDTSISQDPRHLYSTHGLYNVFMQVGSGRGCKDSLTKVVQVYPRPIPSFTSDSVCFGFLTTLSNTSTIDTGKIDEYEWRFGDGITSILKEQKYQFLRHGTHLVNLRAVSDRNCIKDTTIAVIVHEQPLANFEVSDVCFKFPIRPINKSTIGSGSLKYQWRYSDDERDTLENPVHLFERSGIYEAELVATSNQGCKDSIKRFVESYKLPFVEAGKDITTSKGFEVEIKALSDSGLYQWSPVLGLDDNGIMRPKANPEDSTLYTLLVTDKNGCQSSDSMRINVKPDYKLVIYNVITPDGNGQNDVWFIDNAETYPDLHLTVFDRSGREVYHTDGYDNDWTGSMGSDPLPDGSYYYVITFDGSDRKYKGSVTILRNL